MKKWIYSNAKKIIKKFILHQSNWDVAHISERIIYGKLIKLVGERYYLLIITPILGSTLSPQVDFTLATASLCDIMYGLLCPYSKQ